MGYIPNSSKLSKWKLFILGDAEIKKGTGGCCFGFCGYKPDAEYSILNMFEKCQHWWHNLAKPTLLNIFQY